MAQKLDGKALSKKIQMNLKQEIEQFKSQGNPPPKLVVILVGESEASQIYVKNKEKTARALGFDSVVNRLSSSVTQEELIRLVRTYNEDQTVNGILVQLPLPAHIDESQVIEAISPFKDVDGFHPYNMGQLVIGTPEIIPCTPLGIMTLLKESGVTIESKHVVIVGRSNIVGKPLAAMFLNENATVTMTHSKTTDLKYHTQQADILVVATGKSEWITADHVKEGAIVVDVGINRTDSGKVVGDVAYESVEPKVSFITPVPGGVGPMTIAMLMQQTFEQAKKIRGDKP